MFTSRVLPADGDTRLNLMPQLLSLSIHIFKKNNVLHYYNLRYVFCNLKDALQMGFNSFAAFCSISVFKIKQLVVILPTGNPVC